MIKVFGITGTNGKTTVSWMLRSILEQTGSCGLLGTIEHATGSIRHMPENTTPGDELIKKYFDEMTVSGIGKCVMEVSSHGIEQGRVKSVVFSNLGFTNLSRDHLDYHGNMEEYFSVKKKLFTENNTDCVINIDNSYGKRLYRELNGEYSDGAADSCSLDFPYADFYGKIINQDMQGTAIDIYGHGSLCGRIITAFPGKHFASNALLAASMAMQAEVPFEKVQTGLAALKNIEGRMERVGSEDDTLGIIDYAHTPESLEKLLQTFSAQKRGRLLCVFGCGGCRDKGKRQIMGGIAGRYSDYCVITNDNPRAEAPESIAYAIEEGLHPTGCGYSVILDRYQAIKRAVSLADKWDIIIVAGKGHEKYQINGNEKIPFDDKEVLKELLEKKYEKTYDETD